MRRIPRSWLFTPATKPAHYGAAETVRADAVILDLEDSVAPDHKAAAREEALKYLSSPPSSAVARALRINAPRTLFGWQDLTALLTSDADPEFVVIPKSESADVVGLVRALLDEAGKTSGIVALAESANAAADPGALLNPKVVDAVLFGAADMAADLSGATLTSAVMTQARSSLLTSAATVGIPVIDTPFFDTKDAAGLDEAVRSAVMEGFAGKAAIHPAQVGPINAGFTPSSDQIDWARKVVAVNDAGVGTVDGEMIDEAVARRARRILDSAQQRE